MILVNKIHQNTSQSSSVLDLVRSNHSDPPSHHRSGFRERKRMRFQPNMGFGHESWVFNHGFSSMRVETECSGSSTRDRRRNRNLPPRCWINALEWNTGTCFFLALILGFLAFSFSFADEAKSRRKFGVMVFALKGFDVFGWDVFLLSSIKIKIENLIFGKELWWRLKNMTQNNEKKRIFNFIT